ncbi:intraflagellar transport protein 22 homolog [Thrips palmi]|uniref:Intraflagellar transport protein 22 homolog n=1 Tax=Thrips palmi TaxID=161013 RepID=A0A6P8Y4L3_THRPL|nr:intraflagellar transport protein 22 homolog [Thrips palmi]
MFKLKIILIGPKKCGKTVIANFLADATESSGGDYHPTQGVRILQFESANLPVNGQSVKADVELWDCSGDHALFESCWPAFQQGVQGVVMVYDPNTSGHTNELETLYSYFVQQGGLSSKSCLILANPKSSMRSTAVPLSGTFSRVPQTTANIDENGNKLRSEFNSFMSGLISRMRDSHEQEELSIMSSFHT